MFLDYQNSHFLSLKNDVCARVVGPIPYRTSGMPYILLRDSLVLELAACVVLRVETRGQRVCVLWRRIKDVSVFQCFPLRKIKKSVRPLETTCSG